MEKDGTGSQSSSALWLSTQEKGEREVEFSSYISLSGRREGDREKIPQLDLSDWRNMVERRGCTLGGGRRLAVESCSGRAWI
jgi:hypothetical protein